MHNTSNDFSTKLFSLVIAHPWWALLPTLIVTLLFASQLPKIRFLTDLKSILPYDEVYKNDSRIKETFDIISTIDITHINSQEDKQIYNLDDFYLYKFLLVKYLYLINTPFINENVLEDHRNALIKNN